MPKTDRTTAARIVQVFATSHPDYKSFAADWNAVPGANRDAAPEIAEYCLAWLNENPENQPQIDALLRNPQPSKFPLDATALELIMLLFLLRTHVRFKRNPNGKWEFLAEHKAAESKTLSLLLAKLESWLGAHKPE